MFAATAISREDSLASENAAVPAGNEVVVDDTGRGRFQMEAKVGASTILVDEPVSAGGLGAGPNPFDLLSAALGSCTAMTIKLYAERKAWPLSHVRVRASHHRGDLQARDTFSLEICLEGGLDEAQRTRLMEIAEHCPVHLTLGRGAEVVATLIAPHARLGDETKTDSEHMKTMVEACER
jgi:putative redox protein